MKKGLLLFLLLLISFALLSCGKEEDSYFYGYISYKDGYIMDRDAFVEFNKLLDSYDFKEMRFYYFIMDDYSTVYHSRLSFKYDENIENNTSYYVFNNNYIRKMVVTGDPNESSFLECYVDDSFYEKYDSLYTKMVDNNHMTKGTDEFSEMISSYRGI